MINIIDIKFTGIQDPSKDLLSILILELNDYLPQRIRLLGAKVSGNYIHFETEMDENPPVNPLTITLVKGMVMGYLISSGVEVV